MRVEKLAALANIVALVPGAYCAYASWVLLHPAQAPISTSLANQPAVNLTAVLVSFLLAVGLVVSAAVLNAVAAYSNKAAKPLAQTSSDWREGFRNPRWKMVSGHTFRNEAVDIDGKSFRDCRFVNATLVFHGTGPAELVGDSRIEGSIDLSSDDPAVNLYSKFLHILQSVPRAVPRARFEFGPFDGKGNPVANDYEIKEAGPDEVPGSGLLTPEQALALEITRMSSLELSERLKKDPEFLGRVNAIALPPIARSMGPRAFDLAKNIRGLLKEHGSEPGTEESTKRPMKSDDWHRKATAAWREKVNAEFRSRFLEEARRVRDGFLLKRLADARLDELIAQETNTEEGLKEMADKFRYLASQLED